MEWRCFCVPSNPMFLRASKFWLPLFACPLVVYFLLVLLLMAVKLAEIIVGNWLGGLVRGVGNEIEFGSKGKE